VSIDETIPAAAGETAAFVPRPKRPFDCIRHYPALSANA
jgi:hypothetical protein